MVFQICDINNSPEVTFGMISPLVDKYLKNNGKLMFTFKLARRHENSKASQNYVEKSLKLFKETFPYMDNITVKWLLSNRYERTVVATRITL
jgi:hypothetical protein